jgi:hypothetical protein
MNKGLSIVLSSCIHEMNKQLLIAILQLQDVYVMISKLQLELKVYKYSKQRNLSGSANLELTVYNYRFSSLITQESKLQHGQFNLSNYRS